MSNLLLKNKCKNLTQHKKHLHYIVFVNKIMETKFKIIIVQI